MDSKTSTRYRYQDLQYSFVVDRILEQPYDGLYYRVKDDQVVSIEYLLPFDDFNINTVYHTGWLPHLTGKKFVLNWIQTPVRTQVALSPESVHALQTDDNCWLLLLNMHEVEVESLADVAAGVQAQGIDLDRVIVLGSNPTVDARYAGMHYIWVDNYWEALCRKHHRTQSSGFVAPATYTTDTIDRKFLSLNRNVKSHRMQWMWAMQTTGILQQGYVSWHLEQWRDTAYYQAEFVRSGVPKDTRFIGLELDQLPEAVISNTNNIAEYYRKSAFSIITESNSRIPFVTEKTFKAIACMHPFFVVGDNGIHELLRNKGYYTFEEYFQRDTVHTNQEYTALAEYIAGNTVQEFVELTQQHHEQLIHNYNLYFSNRTSWTHIMTQVIQRCN